VLNFARQDFLLNEGCFQLPLWQSPPRREEPLTADCLNNCLRVSAATVLVRIRRAVAAPDGLTLLSAEGADAPTKEKLIEKLPSYADGVYDSTRAQPLLCEQVHAYCCAL